MTDHPRPRAMSGTERGEDVRCPDCGVPPGNLHKDGCDEGGWPTFSQALVWPDSGDEWVIEEGVRCVVAPCCAFTFDAGHTDVEGGGYSCPCCDEIRLRAENERLRRLVAVLFQAEHADLLHRQFVYRSGPQDWDTEPMSEEDHDLIRVALAASTSTEPPTPGEKP